MTIEQEKERSSEVRESSFGQFNILKVKIFIAEFDLR